MTNIRTKPELLSALSQAAKTPVSEEELEKQRVSFIVGSLRDDSTITKAQIREALDSNSGRKVMM